jgi:hypothetical protein
MFVVVPSVMHAAVTSYVLFTVYVPYDVGAMLVTPDTVLARWLWTFLLRSVVNF